MGEVYSTPEPYVYKITPCSVRKALSSKFIGRQGRREKVSMTGVLIVDSTWNMNRIFIGICICISFALKGQQIPHHLPVEEGLGKHLVEQSEIFFKALDEKDSTSLSNLLHKDFLLTSSDSEGKYISKFQYIAGSLMPGMLEIEYYRLHDFLIRQYGNTAIVQSRIDFKSVYRGKPWNADFLNTDIFILENGRWQIVQRHTSYPASQLKEIVRLRYNNE